MTAASRGAQAGFSLLEVMVSVAVLAVLAVGVGLATGRGVSPTERDADRFRRAFDQNWALAITGRETRGLVLTGTGLALAQQRDGRWTAERVLYEWRSRAGFSGDRPAGPGAPDIVLRPDGRSSAFSVVFTGAGPRWRCTSDGWSEVTCAAE